MSHVRMIKNNKFNTKNRCAPIVSERRNKKAINGRDEVQSNAIAPFGGFADVYLGHGWCIF